MIENTNKLKDKIVEFLFFTSFSIYLLFSLIQTTVIPKYFGGEIPKIIFIICFVLLLLKEIVGNSIDLISALICIYIMFVSFYLRHLGIYLNIIIFYIYCARNIDFNKICKLSLLISSIFLLLTILLSITGIIDNYYIGGRYYLGFRYCLFPAQILRNIIFVYLYLRDKKISILEYFILFFINVFMFSYTKAKLSFIIVLMILFLFYIKNKTKILDFLKENAKLTKLLKYSYIICFTLLIIATVAYKYGIANIVNRFLTGRLSMNVQAFNTYSINLFGNQIIENGNGLDFFGNKSLNGLDSYFYVDSLYVYILLEFGVIAFALLIHLTINLINKSLKNDFSLVLIMCLLAIVCTTDDLIMRIEYNVFYLLLFKYPIKTKLSNISIFNRKKQ